jgi:hypothetical protein
MIIYGFGLSTNVSKLPNLLGNLEMFVVTSVNRCEFRNFTMSTVYVNTHNSKKRGIRAMGGVTSK